MTPKPVTPKVSKHLKELGERIRLARLRRKFSADIVCERAGITRPTLLAVEKGSKRVSMGTYAMVLFVLGMVNDLDTVAADDLLGRKLQDLELEPKKRAPKRKKNG